MGKKLIIKGADFENNALINDIDITEIISPNLIKGKHGVSGKNSNIRAGIFPRIDLASYKAQGYNKIEVIVKAARCVTTFLCGTINGNVADGNNYSLTVNPQIGTYIFDMENTYGYYFGANLSLDVADLNGFSDYCQVILKP